MKEKLCKLIIKGLARQHRIVFFEKVDDRESIEAYQVTPVDTMWIDTNRACEGEPMQIRSRLVTREFNSGHWPDFYAVILPSDTLVRCRSAQHGAQDRTCELPLDVTTTPTILNVQAVVNGRSKV